MKQPPPNKGATFRAILIGILLIPFNAYWIMDSAGQGYPTTVSLYFNVVFCIFWMTMLNFAILKLIPRYAFSQGEILTVYVMLSLASSLAGHDMLRVLIPMIPHAFWFATPENEWAELFHRYIPDWVAVKDVSRLMDYYRGESTFYTWNHIKTWITPTLTWSGFLFSLVFVMLCINIFVRKQWTEHEKLSYPIIQLPLEMTKGGGATGALRSKLLWLGFGIAAAIDVINGLNYLYPNVPSLGGKLYDIRPYFTSSPWNAIGWTPIALFPFAVGLAFFIPLDLAFSCWFFYIFWKVERIAGAAIGVRNMPGFPFIDEQSFGAYIGLCIIAIIATRKHLWNVIRKIFTGAGDVNDSMEPLPYRWTMVGMILAFGYIFGFSKLAGMSVWVILAFFAIYYMISTAVTRMRAELGSPVHDLHFIGPDEMLPRMFGTRRLGPQNLTMFAYYFFFNRAYRGHPMPHMLEGFKLAERTRIDNRRLVVAMILAMVMGIIATFWAYLHISYIEGARTWFAWRPFNRLQSWLITPRNPDRPATIAMVIGLGITMFLMTMRMRIFWWPFHPAGFAISSSWSMNVFWFSIFVSSLIKWFILKQGGLKTHRKAIPFFMGLILGEFIIGSIWALIGITIERPMYRFLY
ncbi:TPA: hypothetical protein EYP37_00090 [Candidatus Poribacteria bacterium]|nr:hypothetical protein [Candidatus Poribacteria bacterium]